MSAAGTEDPLEAELERLARAELAAAEEARRHLRQLIEAATTVMEALTLEAGFSMISTSVLIMERDLAEALRETARYDAWRHARRNLVVVKRKLEKTEETT